MPKPYVFQDTPYQHEICNRGANGGIGDAVGDAVAHRTAFSLGERRSDRAELPEEGHQYCSKRYLPVLCSGQVCRFRVLRCWQLRFALFYKKFCFFQVRLVED